MPSEKMRYMPSYPANDILDKSGLPERARAFLDQHSSESLKPFVSEMIGIDDSNIYVLISHVLELTAEEVGLLVSAAIEGVKGRESIIPEDDEQLLWRMIAPILERSKGFAGSGTGRYIEAIEPILVILVLIEKEMGNVEDEGFTLQLLIQDCFKALKDISQYEYDADVARSIKRLCIRYNLMRDEDYLLYDNEWNEVSDMLCKL